MLGKKTLQYIHAHLRDTELPSWVNPVPTNIGTKARGKLSADQWHILCVVHLPIILVPLWYNMSETHRGRLDNFMDLVTEVVIGGLLEMSEPVIQIYEEAALRYLQTAKKLYDITITPNQHQFDENRANRELGPGDIGGSDLEVVIGSESTQCECKDQPDENGAECHGSLRRCFFARRHVGHGSVFAARGG